MPSPVHTLTSQMLTWYRVLYSFSSPRHLLPNSQEVVRLQWQGKSQRCIFSLCVRHESAPLECLSPAVWTASAAGPASRSTAMFFHGGHTSHRLVLANDQRCLGYQSRPVPVKLRTSPKVFWAQVLSICLDSLRSFLPNGLPFPWPQHRYQTCMSLGAEGKMRVKP